MKIIVCIKQVPDTREVRIDPDTGTLIRDGIPSIINLEDKHGIELALSLKDIHGGEVTAITMGPPQADEALREALAMGADKAILVSDRAFGGADTAATAYTLSCAVAKIGQYDLIICGREAIDGNTAQVGPQLAEVLDIPLLTFAEKVSISGQTISVQRQLEDCQEIVQTKLPALVTVVKELNKPRYPAYDAILKVYDEDGVVRWGADTITKSDDPRIGLKGSPTKIRKSSAAEYKKKDCVYLGGSLSNMVKEVVGVFCKEELI